MTRRRLGLGALAAVALWPAPGLAAVDPTAGLRIAPVVQNVSLGVNESSKHFDVTINNNTAVDQAFRFEVEDFGSLDEAGGVAFLGAAPSDFKKQHGLAAWLALDQHSAVVPAKGSLKIAPGGYHIMLEQAAHKIAPGDTVHLKLTFSDGETLVTPFTVKSPATAK